MTYKVRLGKLIFAPFDQIFQINKADKIHKPFSLALLFILLSLLLYGWMGWLGIGSDILSAGAVALPREEYEAAKFSFLTGRVIYALLFSMFLLIIPSLLFRLFFRLPFSKGLVLQTAVLSILLFERLLWIPLYIYFGLDWYASPFSFGPVISIFTDNPLWIYLGGSLTLFFIWITGFQIYYIASTTKAKKWWIWMVVLILHLIYIFGAALVSYYAVEWISLLSKGWIR